MENKTLTRGELAKQSGKNFETIRFYESKGLISHTYRDSSNYRRFKESDAQRLRFIDKAKSLGFTLKEIAEILDVHDNSDKGCQTLGQRAALKLEDLNRQIAELEAKRDLLQRLNSCKATELTDCSCDIVANADHLDEDCTSCGPNNG